MTKTIVKKSFVLIFICIVFASCSSSSEKNQKTADLYYEQGTAALMEQQYTDALAALIKAESIMPNDYKIQNNLGMAYYFKGQISKAIYHIQESLRLNPKNSDARNNLGSIYMQQEKWEQARREYLLVLEDLVYAHQYRVYYNLALLDIYTLKQKQAVNNLLLSLKEKSDYCPAHFLLGEIYEEQRNFESALKSYQNAGKGVCAGQVDPVFKQVVILLKLKRENEAILKFKELKERFPDSTYSDKKLEDLVIQKTNEARPATSKRFFENQGF